MRQVLVRVSNCRIEQVDGLPRYVISGTVGYPRRGVRLLIARGRGAAWLRYCQTMPRAYGPKGRLVAPWARIGKLKGVSFEFTVQGIEVHHWRRLPDTTARGQRKRECRI